MSQHPSSTSRVKPHPAELAKAGSPIRSAGIPESGLVTCRAGLEPVLAAELAALGLKVEKIGRRAVFFRSHRAGFYKANMALRTGLNVLLPLRMFTARDYDMLYWQARKTNWHKLFSVESTVRIDVNGGSDDLTNTQYVVHRVKDGIVDTFRKLCGGARPSISKDDPDIHVVVHLEGARITICLDTSGRPLFKRGYRQHHGEAPLKEDLAAGILLLAGWKGDGGFWDPMCGAGTFCFEAWMIAAGIAPNLDRKFAYQSFLDFDPADEARERETLRLARRTPDPSLQIVGGEADPAMLRLAEEIRREYFPNAPISWVPGDFRQANPPPGTRFVAANPPYGVRLGTPAEAALLHADLGRLIRDRLPGARAAIFTCLPEGLEALQLPAPQLHALFNGALEGRLLVSDLPQR